MIAMNGAATRVALILGLAAGMSVPSVALAESATVTDELGDIFSSSQISDITSARVTYDKRRITIEVEHSAWNAQWKRHRSATGGKLTFSNGRSYAVMSGMGGRRSVLSTWKQLRDCLEGRSCRTIKCSGWAYSIDEANLRTAVSVPARCFPNASARVKVLPFHLIVDPGSAVYGQPIPLEYDPIATTPWIKRG